MKGVTSENSRTPSVQKQIFYNPWEKVCACEDKFPSVFTDLNRNNRRNSFRDADTSTGLCT